MRRPATNRPGSVSPADAHYNHLKVVELDTLKRRLDDGYARIEQARLLGEDVSAWEDFWIDLLHQYELAFDDLPEAA